jgi:hypothetical protein
MVYEYALLLGPAVAVRTLTKAKAEQINERRFNGKGTVIRQVYVKA